MRCPQCHAEVLASDRFCSSCGAGLADRTATEGRAGASRACRQCGQTLREPDRFCGACGTDTRAAARVLARESPSRREPSTAVSPPSPRRLVLFLAYLNVFVCLLAVGSAHLQIQAHAYGEAVYDPFADFVPFRLTWLAILVLTAGMVGFGGFFWTRRTRRDRWRAVIIFVVSLTAIAAAVMNFA